MSTLDLDAVRARANAATKGPWFWQANDKGYPQSILANDDGLVLVAETFTGPEHFPAEAEFIAHARTDIEALCDEVEQLQQSTAVVGGLYRSAESDVTHIMAAITELTHHGDLTPAGKQVLTRIIGGES
jgi:hypothetical protein